MSSLLAPKRRINLSPSLAKANSRGYINPVKFDFDPAKDGANIAKHGLSMADFAKFDDAATIVPDIRREYGEDRFRAFGLIGGVPHSIAFTMRGEVCVSSVSSRAPQGNQSL